VATDPGSGKRRDGIRFRNEWGHGGEPLGLSWVSRNE